MAQRQPAPDNGFAAHLMEMLRGAAKPVGERGAPTPRGALPVSDAAMPMPGEGYRQYAMRVMEQGGTPMTQEEFLRASAASNGGALSARPGY